MRTELRTKTQQDLNKSTTLKHQHPKREPDRRCAIAPVSCCNKYSRSFLVQRWCMRWFLPDRRAACCLYNARQTCFCNHFVVGNLHFSGWIGGLKCCSVLVIFHRVSLFEPSLPKRNPRPLPPRKPHTCHELSRLLLSQQTPLPSRKICFDSSICNFRLCCFCMTRFSPKVWFLASFSKTAVRRRNTAAAGAKN
jgi:hypothetical protein